MCALVAMLGSTEEGAVSYRLGRASRAFRVHSMSTLVVVADHLKGYAWSALYASRASISVAVLVPPAEYVLYATHRAQVIPTGATVAEPPPGLVLPVKHVLAVRFEQDVWESALGCVSTASVLSAKQTSIWSVVLEFKVAHA